MPPVTVADVRRADEDLRHAAAAAPGAHRLVRTVHRLDVDLLDRHAFAGEEAAGARAIRAPAANVHDDLRSTHGQRKSAA